MPILRLSFHGQWVTVVIQVFRRGSFNLVNCLEKWSTSAFVDLSSVDPLDEGGHLGSIPKRVGEHCQALNENS